MRCRGFLKGTLFLPNENRLGGAVILHGSGWSDRDNLWYLHFVMATSDHVVCVNHHICCAGTPDTITNDPQYQKLFPHQ